VTECDRWGGGGQKNRENADVVYGRPLRLNHKLNLRACTTTQYVTDIFATIRARTEVTLKFPIYFYQRHVSKSDSEIKNKNYLYLTFLTYIMTYDYQRGKTRSI